MSGTYAEDFVQFQGVNVLSEMIVVDYEKDFEGTKPDGILGLSNKKNDKNIFDLGFEQGQLVSSTFAFQLGLRFLKQPSFFYFNISEEVDFKDAYFVKASRKTYWTIPVKSMRVGDQNYAMSEALIDTGTSLIIFPQKTYFQLDKDVFSKLCSAYSSNFYIT